MTYYERVWTLQLGFALVALFVAFFGGLAIGYWRWGREEQRERAREVDLRNSAPPPRQVNPELFSAAEDHFSSDLNKPALSGFTTAPSELEAGAQSTT